MIKNTNVGKVAEHLSIAETHMSIAISELGKSAGGIAGWVGSWADYRKLVKLKLRLESIRESAETKARRVSIE